MYEVSPEVRRSSTSDCSIRLHFRSQIMITIESYLVLYVSVNVNAAPLRTGKQMFFHFSSLAILQFSRFQLFSLHRPQLVDEKR